MPTQADSPLRAGCERRSHNQSSSTSDLPVFVDDATSALLEL